jgi:hypothetical protein
MDVRNMAARVIAEIYSGKLSPACAAGLASLLNLQLRAIEVSEIERQLAKLENGATEENAEDKQSEPEP